MTEDDLRRMVDALEERLDDLQSLIRERHGDLSDEYDKVKRCYRLAAGLAVELTIIDNQRRNSARHQSVPGRMSFTVLERKF